MKWKRCISPDPQRKIQTNNDKNLLFSFSDNMIGNKKTIKINGVSQINEPKPFNRKEFLKKSKVFNRLLNKYGKLANEDLKNINQSKHKMKRNLHSLKEKIENTMGPIESTIKMYFIKRKPAY